MGKLILMRHGQSQWNKLNQFTGWVDISLSKEGMDEALEGGEKIKDIPIDVIFSSTLARAQMTAMLAMIEHSSNKPLVVNHREGGKTSEWSKCYNQEALDNCIPVFYAWQLNERMYGELQGLNKQGTREKFGDEQVHIWRRSYDISPPGGESLKLTVERTIPYFEKVILPYLKEGKTVFIAAHGNSLRSITMDIENISQKDIVKLEIPTGDPIIYKYAQDQFQKI